MSYSTTDSPAIEEDHTRSLPLGPEKRNSNRTIEGLLLKWTSKRPSYQNIASRVGRSSICKILSETSHGGNGTSGTGCTLWGDWFLSVTDILKRGTTGQSDQYCCEYMCLIRDYRLEALLESRERMPSKPRVG